MTRQRDEMLDHEFDGIREYNNPPPRWIMMILYGSIVFGIGYWLYYHTYGVGRLLGGSRRNGGCGRASSSPNVSSEHGPDTESDVQVPFCDAEGG
jgi:hypothetical protein